MRRIAAITVVVAGLMVGSTFPAAAGLDDDLARVGDRVERLRAEAGGVRSERSEIANLILDTGERLEAVSAELAAAEGRLADTEREIALTEAGIDDLTGRMAAREQRVAELAGDIDGIKADAVARAVELYMQGQGTAGMPIFAVADVTRLDVGIAYAARVQEVADRLITRLESLSIEAGRERERLAAERDDLAGRIGWLEVQRGEQAAAAALVEERTAEVAGELAVLQEQLDRLDEEVSHIEGEIAALEREEAQIKALIIQQSNAGGTRPSVLLRPVPGGVSSGYGYRIHPIYGDRRLHTGWDMNAGCGAPIQAAESGTVIFSGWKGGYGNAVIIDHGGGMSTLYAHQSRLGASYGDRVSIGDTIGWIGSTGTSTSCHLHFEVRIGGNPVDPSPYL